MEQTQMYMQTYKTSLSCIVKNLLYIQYFLLAEIRELINCRLTFSNFPRQTLRREWTGYGITGYKQLQSPYDNYISEVLFVIFF